MSEPISTAFSLLFIGMITVFVVLFLVVATGNILIKLVNRFAPVAIVPTTSSGSLNDHDHLVAIASAVEILTEGKGRITKIEKEK